MGIEPTYTKYSLATEIKSLFRLKADCYYMYSIPTLTFKGKYIRHYIGGILSSTIYHGLHTEKLQRLPFDL
jgi:hypothetical protein